MKYMLEKCDLEGKGSNLIRANLAGKMEKLYHCFEKKKTENLLVAV